MLAVASNDGHFLGVLAQSVELVVEGSLELLPGNVGQLRLSDEGFGLCAHKLLLKDNDSGRVGLLVLELRDLVGNLLLA